ncbi:Lipoyltransferase and lipoate-protein ligase [Rhodotorula diobovata]|uniref:Putative lipoate-protein ligase A n=1 Tax=Rhodotorula diobovata TaxID=5288 RepID=A0A5C5G6J7_9BASI|nr:Lipoyltransferase and lipoate-protein ligase [Rhodotorula diobovata]
MIALDGLRSVAQTARRRAVPLSLPRRRFFASSPPSLSEANIYVSASHDPWFNLAFEDWLFRKTDPEQRILYLYRNSPSVIIGRNQNPWKEINLTRLHELGIPFVRRKSGGGTVYHDLGNTNYCVFVPRAEFDRRSNAELVTRGLQSLDVPAHVNERHDICVEGFKVSGSAFKLVNKRAYHHGTMLIDAQLGNLRGVLGSKKDSMVTKGVASVPSPVRNLRETTPTVDHARFVEAVAEQFAAQYGLGREVKRIDEGELESNSYVRGVVDELKSWDWQFGQTPEFTHDMSGSFPFGDMTLSITSRHGLVTRASLARPPRPLEWWRAATELCRVLEGDRYGSVERTVETVSGLRGEEGERVRVLLEWLKREM